MKVNSVNNNNYASCQNRPQNFGALGISLIEASKLKNRGERYLPRSARGILDSIADAVSSPIEARIKASKIRTLLGKNDAVLTVKEMTTYNEISEWEQKGVFAQGQALETLEFIIQHAEPLNLKEFAQKVASFDAKDKALIPQDVDPLKALGESLKKHRDKLFAWAEKTTHLPDTVAKTVNGGEFGPATGPTGTIIIHGVPQLDVTQQAKAL